MRDQKLPQWGCSVAATRRFPRASIVSSCAAARSDSCSEPCVTTCVRRCSSKLTLKMFVRNFRRHSAGRRTPLFTRWWGHVRFLWDTGNRLPWVIGAGAGVTMVLFATLMHAMVAGDSGRRELTCLALNVYYESRGEPLEGQYAVAEVTMNRVADSRYPDTVCEAVYQKKWDYLRKRHVGAFSWTELDDNKTPRGEAWDRAVSVAQATYSGRRGNVLDGAVHYHASYIRPSWSRGKKPVAKIGRHLFYR